MLFDRLAETSRAVGATSKRSEKTALLAATIALLDAHEVAEGVTFLSGEVRQQALGVGYATVFGSVPDPADESELSVAEVHASFEEISQISGDGSVEARSRAVRDLLASASESGQEMLIGLMAGELRQGAQAGLVQDAVAKAFGIPATVVRRAAMLSGDLGEAARLAQEGGREALEAVGLHVGRAIQPMLASTAQSAEEAIERVGEASVEWKLDGARIQVHRSGDDVRVFTRNLRDISQRLPGVAAVVRALDVESVVLDGEAISLDHSGAPIAFQDTASAFGTELGNSDFALRPFFFDLIHVDGNDLLDEPLSRRWQELERIVPESARVARVVTSDPAEAEQFFDDAVARRHEGVVVKALDSTYQAGRRGKSWIKVKPVHTLDLVVLAAEWGHGRRTGWLSNLHLGARDPESGKFVMLGKTFKGLTDELLVWQTARFQELETRRTQHIVYVRPEQVVEIAFDGVQRSTRYPGGVALRFARVKRYRDDKPATDADTIEMVRSFL